MDFPVHLSMKWGQGQIKTDYMDYWLLGMRTLQGTHILKVVVILTQKEEIKIYKKLKNKFIKVVTEPWKWGQGQSCNGHITDRNFIT